MNPARSRLTLRHTMILFISLIIIIVIGFLLTFTYIQTQNDMIRQNQYLQDYSEMNLAESLTLVDRGLKLFDDTLNKEMEAAFLVFIEAYENSGGTPEQLDLPALQDQISQEFQGEIDLYVINDTGVIIASTVPEVLYLDFKNYPDFYNSITEIRQGDSFAADRVVRSVENTSSGAVSGKLRKFAFMPTPDHIYLLEMGLVADSFETERSGLSYVDAGRRTAELNPNIMSIRIFDINRNLLLEQGVNPFSSVNRIHLDEAFIQRASFNVPDLVNDTVVRFLFVDLKRESSASDMSLVAEITYSNDLLKERLNQILLFYLAIALITIGMGMVLTYHVTRYLTTPIGEIVEDVEEIAGGELDHTIRGMPNPEFRRLESAINIMISRIREISEELEREKAELRIAADIQKIFLPRSLPRLKNFDIAAENVPAKEVGGDFYDFIPLEDSTLGIVIADVAGKGIPAALFMALSRSIVRAIATADNDVRETIEESNDLITADAVSGMFVTLFYGVLDENSKVLSYVNAGHNPPLHYQVRSHRIVPLMPTGIVLGVEPDMKYSVGQVEFHTGDLLVMYTDGVTEAFNEEGEQFGEDRLVEIIRENQHLDACMILDLIRDAVERFCGTYPQSDDITLVVIKSRFQNGSGHQDREYQASTGIK
ncbi:MAG TPA: SpoIIE family protein phosphatase [Methanoregulaceae archaeon]|nr:SpoIIE family protein phosphatase [Methanoregulaceae archaeon]